MGTIRSTHGRCHVHLRYSSLVRDDWHEKSRGASCRRLYLSLGSLEAAGEGWLVRSLWYSRPYPTTHLLDAEIAKS